MVFAALIALFGVDSVITYLGITHSLMAEANPVVRHLIEVMGLATTMYVIFFFKTLLILVARTATQAKPAFLKVWRGLFIFYAGALAGSWLAILR